VIFNTKLRFWAIEPGDIGNGPRSLHHQDAPRFLVKVIEEFIPPRRQRPDIDDTFAAGRDDLLHAQLNAFEFHSCRVEILHFYADRAIGGGAYLARLKAMVFD
jgi:hypothetical protein